MRSNNTPKCGTILLFVIGLTYKDSSCTVVSHMVYMWFHVHTFGHDYRYRMNGGHPHTCNHPVNT